VPANQDLVTLLRSRAPLILIESAEEGRVIEAFRHAIAQSLRPLHRWSITDGLRRLDIDDEESESSPPDASMTLQAIRDTKTAGVYLLLDFQPYLRYPMTLRLMREIVLRQEAAEHTLVLVGAGYELPPELAAQATRYELALPDADALAALVREEAFACSREIGRRVEVDTETARAVVRNLRGLGLDDARRIVRKLIYDDGALTPADLPELARAKHRLLDREGLLHFEYETAEFANVAGLARERRRRVAARARLSADVDGRAQGARIRRRDRERRDRFACGAPAQGALRRSVLRGPSRCRDARGDIRPASSQARASRSPWRTCGSPRPRTDA